MLFRTLYTTAANRVAIDRYQCARVLQARFVSVISTDDSRHLLLFCRAPSLGSPINICTLLLNFFQKFIVVLCSFFYIFSFLAASGYLDMNAHFEHAELGSTAEPEPHSTHEPRLNPVGFLCVVFFEYALLVARKNRKIDCDRSKS